MTRLRAEQLRTRPSLQSLEARDLPGFLAPVSYPPGPFPEQPAVADLNNDGRRDVLVALRSSSVDQVAVLLGNGDGTLQPPITFPTGHYPYQLQVADLNADGKL